MVIIDNTETNRAFKIIATNYRLFVKNTVKKTFGINIKNRGTKLKLYNIYPNNVTKLLNMGG